MRSRAENNSLVLGKSLPGFNRMVCSSRPGDSEYKGCCRHELDSTNVSLQLCALWSGQSSNPPFPRKSLCEG